MKNARKLARSRRHKDYFNECWDYVEFCGERLNLSVSYEKQKDYIKNLYKNEDYMTLERVFSSLFQDDAEESAEEMNSLQRTKRFLTFM